MTSADTLSDSMLYMLRQLAQANAHAGAKFGYFDRFIDQSQLVMLCAESYDNGLAWRIADRTLGALLRRGLIDRHPAIDDLIAISAEGIRAISQTSGALVDAVRR
jgi:hypothetical protein